MKTLFMDDRKKMKDTEKSKRTTTMPGIIHSENLPPCKLNFENSVTMQLARYFRTLLAEHADRNGVVILPPLQVLAERFGVSEIEVFDAFYEMTQQGYEYSLKGIESLVTLRDPMAGTRQEKHEWEVLARWSPIRMLDDWLAGRESSMAV